MVTTISLLGFLILILVLKGVLDMPETHNIKWDFRNKDFSKQINVGIKNRHVQQSSTDFFNTEGLKAFNVLMCFLNFYDTIQDFPNILAHTCFIGGIMQSNFSLDYFL